MSTGLAFRFMKIRGGGALLLPLSFLFAWCDCLPFGVSLVAVCFALIGSGSGKEAGENWLAIGLSYFLWSGFGCVVLV